MPRLFFAAAIMFAVAMPFAVPVAAQTADEAEAARQLYMAGDYDAAMVVLVPAADAGDPMAQNVVGVGYQYGHGLPVDAKRAVTYFQAAAAQDFPAALHNLGVLYNDGMPGVSIDYVRARAYFEQAIAAGYELSYSNLALLLQDGLGGPTEMARAIDLLQTGADVGDGYAADALAYSYSVGLGVQQDDKRARAYYQRAADLGLPQGVNNLASMYETGRGGPMDLAEALRLYEQARDMGYVYAAINIAWMVYENPDAFPDQVMSLANCYWAVNNAEPVDSATYAESCDGLALEYSPEVQAQAVKRAQSL